MRIKFVILTILSLVFLPLVAQNKFDKPFTVVIDAGHGGKDPGAVGKKAKEKDLNLSVALLAGKLIHDSYPEVEVLYTRQTDEFITLQGRADFVNKHNADLFICIHTNAVDNRDTKGAETFVLGTDKLDKNLDVAMRENAVIKLEADYQTAYQGFDPNSIDSYIMFELMQNRYMDQSLHFAELVQQQFSDVIHRADRGVRQAAFWVLLKSACPSVLVEMGFVSNPDEEKYLLSAAGQQEMAGSIQRAFASFYRKPTQLPAPKADVSLHDMAKDKHGLSRDTASAPLPKIVSQEASKTPMFAVQIAARKTPLAPNDPALQGLNCQCIERDGWYKYYYGAQPDREAVKQIMQDLRTQFPDCFIIRL